MKITAINGSPRGKESTTYLMVEQFLEGAREAGAETEHILLSKMKIHHCMGCFTCWVKTPGKCIFDDDMSKIRLDDTDILVYATPLYVDNVSGLMKNFMDRSVYHATPFIEKDANGESFHKSRTRKEKKMVVIANAGFPEQSHFEVLKLLFRRFSRNAQVPLIAEIYRGGGPLLRADSSALEEIVENYKALLRKTGREVVVNGQLSDETKELLERPLIPYESYREMANCSFKEELEKI